MTILAKIFLFASALILLLAACGEGPQPLGQAGQPTLVFIYTDG
jgi:hypothetical protein